MPTPRVKDNDLNEITVTLDGKEIRGWSYENEAERRVKIGRAREFVEGWLECAQRMTPFHPDILAAHAQFGGDLADMQRRYDQAGKKTTALNSQEA